MKKLLSTIGAVGLLAATLQAQQVGLYPRVNQIMGSYTICSNMTTNVTTAITPVVCYRDRGMGVLATFKSVTNEPVGLIVTWQVSTNKPNDTSTNWFTPYPAITSTFTNYSGILANKEYALIAKTSLDNIYLLSPYSIQSTSTTNNVTNFFLWTTVYP